MRHAVAHGVDVDERIVGDAPAEPLLARRQRPRRQRPQRRPLVALEADRAAPRASCRGSRSSARRHPRGEMRLERGERRRTRSPASALRFTYFDARFGLALGARAVRRARARLHVPVAAERADRPGGRRTVPVVAIAAEHQRARVVAEQRARHAAEVREGRRDPLAPVVLALVEKGFDEEPPRVAQHRDEQRTRAPTRRRSARASRRSRSAAARPAPSRSAPSPAPRPACARRMSATARSTVRTLTATPRSRQQPLHDDRVALGRARRTAPAPRRAPPSVSRRAVGRTWTPGHAPAARRYRRTVLRATPDARARSPCCPHPRLRQLANRGHQLALDHRHLRCRRYQLVPLELHPSLPRGGQF